MLSTPHPNTHQIYWQVALWNAKLDLEVRMSSKEVDNTNKKGSNLNLMYQLSLEYTHRKTFNDFS